MAGLVYGANMDDLGDHRPGMEAAKRMGVRAPLIDAEFWKTEIRELSREFDLPTWDKPSFACLSSRFQYGDGITSEKLRQVDAAEAFVRSLGFKQFRVRHHDRLARGRAGRAQTPRPPPRPAPPPAGRGAGGGGGGGGRRGGDRWTAND